MDISFLGAGGVRLSGRQLTILANPTSDAIKKLKAKPDVVLLSSADETVNAPDSVVLDGAGEYEVKGALITGIAARRHTDEESEGQRSTIYRINIDGYNVVYLGNVAANLSDTQMEQLGQVDVLVVPVGGHGLTLDAVAAAGITTQVEPKYVIPVHYDDGVTEYPMPQAKAEEFLKEMGANPDPVPKLRLTSKELPAQTTVVLLELV